MQNSKYGRIFTEEDVRNLVRAGDDFAAYQDALEAVEETVGTKFPSDEPVFVLRAKDKRALGALRFYRDHQSPRANREHLDNIDDAVNAFESFRHKHPELMKEPD